MNKELEQLYAQYSQVNDISRDVFLNSYEQFGDTYINFIQEALKKKENSQETPSNSSGLGENQPTPISAQGNPQITSVPISQDLDLNKAQMEAKQGVQNPASLNLELPQQSLNQNGLLESNGEVNTSSSVLEDSFNNFIQEGGQLPLNPTSTRLNVLPRAYENQFNNVTESTPQEEVGNVSLPKKSRIDLATFDINGLQEIPIPTKSISDELGNVVAKINNDVVKAYKTPSGQTILQTGVGLIPEEVYLSLKDKEGKQRTPQSKDVYENINGVFVEQDYSEVPINETIKSYKGYDYISSKDEDGTILSENEIDTNLFLGLQAKGLGELGFHEDGTPRFKINKDTAYILDSIFLSETNKEISTRNAIRNSAYISSVYEGAELEKNARENFISRYGQANYDKYGVLPPQVMDRLQYEERVQNYVSQGYTEQEAVQYANTYRERELQGVREENNFILNNIFSKLKSEDSQEKQAWITFAKSYPKEFRDFFNEYTEKFGDEAWDNSYLLKRFDNPMRRASIKDEFINYLKTLQVYSQIELKNKAKQAKADVRFGAENKNADLINQGYAKLNNLNMISKFIQGENTAITTLEDQTKPLFKQAYEKGIENAKLESSANRNELLGVLELGAKKIGNFPVRVIGNLFQSATSFFTGNSDWSKYVNEDIEFSKNAFELNKNAEELRTEVVTYKDKQGNIYKLRDGNIYKVDKNGYEFYKPELDNNLFKANLTEISRDKEWNGTSVTAQGIQLIAEVYLMNRLGTFSGNLMSKPFGSYAVRIAKELGTESRYYNIFKSAYKGIRASENASPFGMAVYTFGGMTKRNDDLGYDGLESWFKGMFDAGMMYAANRFFPDARFFKDGDKVQKTAFNLLKNGDKKGALELTKNFFIDASYYAKTSAPDIVGEMFEEMGLERMFQGVSDVVSGAFKQDKKIWEKAIDPNNFVDLSPETALLTALSTGTIKGVQNLKTSPLASFEGMTDLEKVILSTNMEGLPDALRFISSDASFAGFTGSKATRRLLEMQTAKKYLDQLPKDNTLTLSQTADVITNLQKLDNLKKEQEKATSESVKKQYQEQIDSVEEAIAKKFEESKNNTIVDEQPQTTTQPEQTQETAQGQTAETNLQPEQTTVAGEQSVSTDLEVDKNQNIEQNAIQEQTTNEGIVKSAPEQSADTTNVTSETISNTETTQNQEVVASQKKYEEKVADIETRRKAELEPLNKDIVDSYATPTTSVSKSERPPYSLEGTANGFEEVAGNKNSTQVFGNGLNTDARAYTPEMNWKTKRSNGEIVSVSPDAEKGRGIGYKISELKGKRYVTFGVEGTDRAGRGSATSLTLEITPNINEANFDKVLDLNRFDYNGILTKEKSEKFADDVFNIILNPKEQQATPTRSQTEISKNIQDINAKYDAELEQLKQQNKEEQPRQETAQQVETQKVVEPIGQLGDGSNIYLETPKYRLNDYVKGGYILNISDISNSLTPLKSVEFTDLNEAKYVADYFVENAPNGVVSESSLEDFLKWAKEDYQKIKNNTQTNEAKQATEQKQSNVGNTQTLEIIGDKANETAISEEEQEKINLERLYAYIEAKKQREQEQQVQVSPSGEIENVQQNEAFSVNEQPQTIEQTSETQNAPLASESKSTNGKYTIRVEQNNGIGTAKILDNNGNEVKLTNKQKEKYVAEHFAKQTYPETVVEDADKLNPSEFNQELVKTSNNPIELAQILDTESEFIPSDLLDAKENAIANVIGKKVSRSSFIQFDDANNITFSIAKGYGLTNKGKTIDVIAQEAEVLIYGDWDSQNPRVTTEDVINFMKTYNNGADTFFRQPNPTYRDAAGKFEKLTGIKATKNALDVLLGKKTATKIDFAKLQEEADLLSAEQAYNLEKEYNEWFNSLSLEDKNLELQKTYPYEQRTEENTNQSQNESISNNETKSSENVANQERDGATTEEINQVSPSPQYEGKVTYTQFGEGQEGTIYYEDGVAKIKDKAGKVYNANSPLVKNLKDAEGNAIQLQKGNQRLTPITKQAFDALVKKLQKAFPRFAKVTYDFEAFKKQAEKLGATFNDIQRMVMAFHGSPHSFPKEILVENELGEREYLVGDSDSFPEVPKGYKVIEKFPFGRFRLDKMGTGEGAQAFGWGLYFAYLEDIAREYANKLTEPSFYVNGILQGENFKNNYPDLYNVGIELFGAKSKEDAINKVTNSAILSEKEKRRAIEVLSGIDSFKSEKNNRNLYKVSLHKGKQHSEYTWLEWDKEVPDSIYNTIGKKLKSNGKFLNELFQDSMEFEKTDGTKVKGKRPDGLLFYKRISQILGSDKDASLWLLSQGIDGIKYPAESISRGATSDNARGFNYVVFDENAVTIEDKIQFMQTPNGTIYGAKLPDGTIYLNPEFLNANTPIHEFSHLFEQLLPSRFKKGVELLKQTNLGKKLFEQLKQEGNYANLTDEQLWGEALNTHIGNFGENEVNNTKGKLKQLQDWIKDFFAKVGDVLGIKKLSPDTQLRMFTEGVVKDLLGGKPIVAENQVSPSEQVKYNIAGENAILNSSQISALFTAKQMDENGDDRNKIILATNWYKGEGGKWRMMMNFDFKLKEDFLDKNDKSVKLKDIVDYKELFNLYPQLSDVEVEITSSKRIFPDSKVNASYLESQNKIFINNGKGNNKEQLRLYIGHEIQHAIQSIEGFKGGTNYRNEYSKATEIANSIRNGIEINSKFNTEQKALSAIYGTDWIKQFKDGLINENNIAQALYESDFGEIEANMVMYLLNTPEELRANTLATMLNIINERGVQFSINSTTPLSVKEQTEVINELVANGEESAFAKLQETNWYKALSDNQKQNINPTNIAETVINAVNANKRNLKQKVERREKKIESIKDRNYWRKQALNSIKLILNDKTINDKITPNEINRLIKLSEKLNTVKDIDKYFDEFGEKVDKIIEDAEKRLSTKEKLQAQKEELKAKEEKKIDAIKSVKEVIQQTINDASERGLFKGITSSKVLEYAMRNINKAITPSQQKRVLNTVKKIINDNEYLNKIAKANNLAKRVKKDANSKAISKPLVNIDTAKQFAKINPRNVENIDDYIELANAIIGNLKGISVNNKLEVSNKKYGTNNESILKYIEDTLKYNENVKEEELKADYDELLRTSTLPVKDMTFDEYKDFINLSKLEENAQKFENNSKATQEERTNLLRATVNRRLKNDFETEILANKSEYSSEEKKIINRISKIDTSKLDYKQLVKLNDVINNSIYNNSFMDAGNISLIAQVQENEKAIDDFKVKNNFNFLSLSDNWATRALQGAISNDMLVEFITNSTTASAFLKIKSGISAVMDGHAIAKVIQQKTVNAFINMKKKVGWKSDTTENRYIRGIYAEMLRNNGGTVEEIQSEWDRKKGLIEQTIDGLANSRNKEDNKASELLQKVYDKTLKDANNISELEANISKLEFGKFNIDSVKFWIEQHDKYADDFIEQGNIYNNKNLEKELNYTGRKYRPITEDAQKKQDNTLFDEVYRSTEISYKESGSKTKTVKNKFLPKGLVLDLDFDKVQAKMLYDNLYDLKTAEGISLLKNFLSNPENIDRIGGTRNMEALKNMMRNTILAQKQALPFENDNFAKALDKIAGSVMMKSARLALGSVTQLPKQYLSVLVNTSVNLGTDMPLLFEAYRVSGFRNNLELFDKFNIGLRGSTIAGYNKENAIFADENAGAVYRTKAILYDVNKASKALYDGTMKALELSDVSIARTTWLAFYMKSLKKQGVDITKIDWSKEHENPNQEAAAFAEQTVSRLQNANDASSMADAFKNTNTYAKVFKNLFMPYSTFAVNQRARMTSDMQKIIHGSIDGRAEAFKSLIATIAEQVVFNSFKTYVLANGAQYLAELFLTGILGWDDDEAEDLFKNAKKYAKQKFVTSTVSDIFFSGMGSGTQTGLQLFANKLTKLINGEEYFYDYKNDPEKTGIPNSISVLGGYGTSIATFLGLANDMKYLDGEGEEIVKGGGTNNVVMRPKELSKESKQLVYLTFMVDALALAGLGDQYISQINQKIKKARDKKIKDDLGSYFDTRIYIPSSSDNYKNYAKLRIDKKTSISDIKQMAKKEGAYLNEKTFSRKMKDEIFNYKVSKHRDEIEDKLLNYREGKINRDQLRNYVKSLKDLSYDQQVKLWKTFPKDNKK